MNGIRFKGAQNDVCMPKYNPLCPKPFSPHNIIWFFLNKSEARRFLLVRSDDGTCELGRPYSNAEKNVLQNYLTQQLRWTF